MANMFGGPLSNTGYDISMLDERYLNTRGETSLVTLNNDLNLNENKILNIKYPTEPRDVITVEYLNQYMYNFFNTKIKPYVLEQTIEPIQNKNIIISVSSESPGFKKENMLDNNLSTFWEPDDIDSNIVIGCLNGYLEQIVIATNRNFSKIEIFKSRNVIDESNYELIYNITSILAEDGKEYTIPLPIQTERISYIIKIKSKSENERIKVYKCKPKFINFST